MFLIRAYVHLIFTCIYATWGQRIVRGRVTEQGAKRISLSDIPSVATPVSPSTGQDCKLRAEGGALHLNRSSNRQFLHSDTGAGL